LEAATCSSVQSDQAHYVTQPWEFIHLFILCDFYFVKSIHSINLKIKTYFCMFMLIGCNIYCKLQHVGGIWVVGHKSLMPNLIPLV
jgi:hypothetical protein